MMSTANETETNGSQGSARPELLFYCQHSLGLGHLVRTLALAEGLAARFDVTILNGGRLPEGTRVPERVRLVNLPPLGHDDQYELVSHDQRWTVAQAMTERTTVILEHIAKRPAVLLVELFPFGRKKFAFELMPLLEAAHALGTDRPVIVCSLRDILVSQRRDQRRHDERASQITNAFFDAVLVHGDPTFARLEESFVPDTPLQVPVHYTGFVTTEPPYDGSVVGETKARVLVSAGGGMVGAPLFDAAIDAHHRWAEHGLTTTIVAGPFAPDEVWERLLAAAAASPNLEVIRRVDDLRAEMQRSAITVSQCGYNTTMDILRANVPTVVVPFSEGKEDEQRRRAERFERAGLLTVVDASELPAGRLEVAVVEELRRCGQSTRPRTTLDLGGQRNAAAIIDDLVRARDGRTNNRAVTAPTVTAPTVTAPTVTARTSEPLATAG